MVAEQATEPRRIILEITETAVVTNPARARSTLARLHDAGFGISVDDFGVGQTSLAHLVTLPVDELKIERGLVSRIREDSRSAAIVSTVIELGHSLGMTVTAHQGHTSHSRHRFG